MIHSLSGGVLSEYGSYTFVKVTFEDGARPYWYVSDFEVSEGDIVLAPFGGGAKRATVVKVEQNVSGQVTPIPLRSAKKLISKVVE